jgi:hypothetical protein
VYRKGVEIAEKRGNILADTKLEFGLISEKKKAKKMAIILEDRKLSDHQNKWRECMITLLTDNPGEKTRMLDALIQKWVLPLSLELFRQSIKKKQTAFR